jgi:hypothetical protein
MKTSIALIAGVVLLLGGLAGGAVFVLGSPEPKEQRPTPAEIALERVEKAIAARDSLREEKERLAWQQSQQDDADIRRIVEAKVAETSENIDEAFFEELFTFIPNTDSLLAYREDLLRQGAAYDVDYSAEFAAQGDGRKVQSRDPRFYINTKAGEIIHAPSPPERLLRGAAKGFLALGVYREYLLKEKVWADMRPEIMTTYFQKSVKRLQMLIEIEQQKGRNPALDRQELVRIREVIAMDRYLRMGEARAVATERYSQTTYSAASATSRIGQWRKTLKEQLLELGRLYVDAAVAETRYFGKRQEHADRSFKALAMVHRMDPSGDALSLMIKANRIQRDYLWRMAKSHWKRAKKADNVGDLALAGEEYLLAKRRYLQALSRIEGSKQKYLYKELRVLQGDIRSWYHEKNAEEEDDPAVPTES